MSLLSHLAARLLRLPPADTTRLTVTRDLPVPMPDGAVLLADHYAPENSSRLPTLLVRSPYGRAGLFGLLFGRLFAERGFQVLIQSVRGTFGSGGTFHPFHQEGSDGLATVAWMRAQPWYGGTFGTVGLSYLGLVQWAIAKDAGPELRAIAPMVTASEFQRQTYPGGAFSLYNALSWIYLIANQEQTLSSLKVRFLGDLLLGPRFNELPLASLDQRALGHHTDYFQGWLAHNQPGDPWWSTANYDQNVPHTEAPASFVAGWQDIFLPWQLRDYERLRAAGKSPRLHIGPWTHTDPALIAYGLRDALAWMRAHLLGDSRGLDGAPVRVFVTGAKEWRSLETWPPPSTETRWHLQPGGALAQSAPPASEPDRYRYDPSDPTPSVGGPLLGPPAGVKDNRRLEARQDVRCYTSAPLDQALTLLGPVRAELFVRASRPHTDVFVRLCDVDTRGRSWNVCDGLLRLLPESGEPAPDGTRKITVELWPAGHCFRRGHRLRVQVSGGAHPRYARNLGSSDPLASGATPYPVVQEIFHDPARPSALLLPVV